jgi:peptidoglycan biosynthesis protein MviN/MurJ (putative lipid II flippase)
MRRHLRRLETRQLFGMVIKVALACAALALTCWLMQRWLFADWLQLSLLARTAALLSTIAAAALAFVAAGAALRIAELRQLTAAVGRRLRRR